MNNIAGGNYRVIFLIVIQAAIRSAKQTSKSKMSDYSVKNYEINNLLYLKARSI